MKHPVYGTFYLTAVCKNRQPVNYQNNRRLTLTNNLRGVANRPLSLIPFPKCSYIYFSNETNINGTISRSFTSPPCFLLCFGSDSCQTGFAWDPAHELWPERGTRTSCSKNIVKPEFVFFFFDTLPDIIILNLYLISITYTVISISYYALLLLFFFLNTLEFHG